MKNSIRIKSFMYDVSQETQQDGSRLIILTPRTGGSIATSAIEYSDYAYTHGGKVFQAAVREAKKIAASN